MPFLSQYLHLLITRLPVRQFFGETNKIQSITGVWKFVHDVDQLDEDAKSLRSEQAPQLFLIYVLSKIANEKGIARRIIFCILQE